MLPKVRLFFAANRIKAVDGGWALVPLQPSLVIKAFPQPINVHFFLQIAGGLGTTYLRVDIVNERGSTVFRSMIVPLQFDASNRHVGFELTMSVEDWVVKEPGAYDAILFCNHVAVTSWPFLISDR